MASPFILLIDDERAELEFLRTAHAAAGFHVHIEQVFSGEEGLGRMMSEDRKVPDLILLDLNLPGMQGKEALLALRYQANLADVPIVIYTSNCDPRIGPFYRALGADEVFVKANDLDGMVALTERIEAIVARDEDE